MSGWLLPCPVRLMVRCLEMVASRLHGRARNVKSVECILSWSLQRPMNLALQGSAVLVGADAMEDALGDDLGADRPD
jgi:hypothetical protein